MSKARWRSFCAVGKARYLWAV